MYDFVYYPIQGFNKQNWDNLWVLDCGIRIIYPQLLELNKWWGLKFPEGYPSTIDTWRMIQGTNVKHCSYKNQDEDTNQSKLVYNKD